MPLATMTSRPLSRLTSTPSTIKTSMTRAGEVSSPPNGYIDQKTSLLPSRREASASRAGHHWSKAGTCVAHREDGQGLVADSLDQGGAPCLQCGRCYPGPASDSGYQAIKFDGFNTPSPPLFEKDCTGCAICHAVLPSGRRHSHDPQKAALQSEQRACFQALIYPKEHLLTYPPVL